MKVHFELTGETPLLMHNDDVLAADKLGDWRKHSKNQNASIRGDDRSPPWTWQTYLYGDGEHVAIPQENIMASLMYGGAKIVIKGSKTFKELSQSGLLMSGEFCKFYNDGKQVTATDIEAIRDKSFSEQVESVCGLGFELYLKRARVGASKHVRVRPRFNTWSCTGTIGVFRKELNKDVLTEIFEHAGRGGIGDWRPSSPKRPGPFGMFTSKLKFE